MLPFPGWSGRGVRPFFIQYLLMKKILQWMASPRLACVLMAYAVLLIFSALLRRGLSVFPLYRPGILKAGAAFPSG